MLSRNQTRCSLTHFQDYWKGKQKRDSDALSGRYTHIVYARPTQSVAVAADPVGTRLLPLALPRFLACAHPCNNPIRQLKERYMGTTIAKTIQVLCRNRIHTVHLLSPWNTLFRRNKCGDICILCILTISKCYLQDRIWFFTFTWIIQDLVFFSAQLSLVP